MTLPSPAHTLARLAAPEAAVDAWATARRLHSSQPATVEHLDQLRQAEKVLLTLAPDAPTPREQV